MQTFMQWLGQGLESINLKTSPVPRNKIEKDEIILGQVGDDVTKKLFALRYAIDEEMKNLMPEMERLVGLEKPNQADHNPVTCERCKLRRKTKVLTDRMERVSDLMWTNIEHGLSEEATIKLEKSRNELALREDWTIMATPPQPESAMISMIGIDLLSIIGR